MSRDIIIQELKKISKDYSKKEKIIYDLSNELKIDYNNLAYDKLGELYLMNEILDGANWDSKVYDNIREKIEIENKRVINPPDVKKGIFKCKKCKSEKTWSYQLQTRSGDEGMTNFITCSNCGNKWKF